MANKIVAEYANQTASNPQVSYLTQDHLGSPRIITGNNGEVISRHDYMAFGADISETLGNVANSATAHGYGKADEIRKQYTGYEHDDESGLDFAQARYYNSSHGRFTSIDPLTASANVKDPQTFNRYTYAMNSPYKFTDPLGLISSSTNACGQWCSNAPAFSAGPAADDFSWTVHRLTERGQLSPLLATPPPPPGQLPSEVTASKELLKNAEIWSKSMKPKVVDAEFNFNKTATGIFGDDGQYFFDQGVQEKARFDEAMKQIDVLEKDIAKAIDNADFKFNRANMEVGKPINFNSQEVSVSVGITVGEIISGSAELTRTMILASERVSEYNKIVADNNVEMQTRMVNFADNPEVGKMNVRLLYLAPRTIRFNAGENSHIKASLERIYTKRMNIARTAGHDRLK